MTVNIHSSSKIDEAVSIEDEAAIGPYCHLTGNIAIGCGTHLVAGITLVGPVVIGRNCIIESNVSVTSMDPLNAEQHAKITIGDNCVIGAGSILAKGINIGPNAQVAPGTIVTRNVPPHALVSGNPIKITGYANLPSSMGPPKFEHSKNHPSTMLAVSAVRGVTLTKFPRARDLRGDLSVGEFERNIPFIPKRYFVVFDVPSTETRGEHAHRKCEQFLICIGGSVSVIVDDGDHREEIELDSPDIGLYIPPRVWGLQYKYSANATLLVFASDYYDPDDYIRDYQQFLQECKTQS